MTAYSIGKDVPLNERLQRGGDGFGRVIGRRAECENRQRQEQHGNTSGGFHVMALADGLRATIQDRRNERRGLSMPELASAAVQSQCKGLTKWGAPPG